MDVPKIPINEKSRLEALHNLNLLDTEPELRFDRITKLAQQIFGVPIVAISLVDEKRQWFKSIEGLNVRETSRDVSFCGHTILDNEAFIIPDATKDKRFADNPLVTAEPKVRFYCGIPLQTGDSNNIGTLCIIDTKPRNLTQKELETLNDLAALAKAEIAILEAAYLERKILRTIS